MTDEEKQVLFQGVDRVIGVLSLFFDQIRKVAFRDGLKGFHKALDKLTCEECNAKLLGICAGQGYEKTGVLMCMEHKDMRLHSTHTSMN